MFKGTILIASIWEPKLLADKLALKLAKIGVTLVHKDLQVLDSRRGLLLLGTPNSNCTDSVKEILVEVMQLACHDMTENHSTRYPEDVWNASHIPKFLVVKDYADNAPWVVKEKDERTPNWQKMMLQIEYAATDADFMEIVLRHGEKMGLLFKYFGMFTILVKDIGRDAELRQKTDLGTLIARHGSTILCMGSIKLRGLTDGDRPVCLRRHPLADGVERAPILRTVRDVLTSIKVNNMRLFQTVMADESGAWVAYYLNGKGCMNHSASAQTWGGNLAAEFRFYLLKRGFYEEDITSMLEKCFTPEAMQTAMEAKLDKHGNVINRSQAHAQRHIAFIENCPWIDATAGLCKSELAQLHQVSDADHKPSAIDPRDASAYNFADSDGAASVKRLADKVNRRKADDDSTIVSVESNKSIGDHTQFDPPSCYVLDGSDEEEEFSAFGGSRGKYGWELDLGEANWGYYKSQSQGDGTDKDVDMSGDGGKNLIDMTVMHDDNDGAGDIGVNDADMTGNNGELEEDDEDAEDTGKDEESAGNEMAEVTADGKEDREKEGVEEEDATEEGEDRERAAMEQESATLQRNMDAATRTLGTVESTDEADTNQVLESEAALLATMATLQAKLRAVRASAAPFTAQQNTTAVSSAVAPEPAPDPAPPYSATTADGTDNLSRNLDEAFSHHDNNVNNTVHQESSASGPLTSAPSHATMSGGTYAAAAARGQGGEASAGPGHTPD